MIGGSSKNVCDRLSDCQTRGMLSGELADLQIWSRVLTDQEMTDFTGCDSAAGAGDMLDWEAATWDEINVGKHHRHIP